MRSHKSLVNKLRVNVVLPEKLKILAATAIALAIASVVLVVAVLPAEYGIDPLKTGQALGLMGLSSAEADEVPLTVARGVNTSQPNGYKIDTVEIRLRPSKAVEYKYRMENGGSLLYSWTATGKLIYDFHGQPDGGSSSDSKSYDKRERGEESDRANGAFTAPFTGVHGWYWENPGSDEVTIRLTSAGFYSRAEQFMEKGGHFVYEVGDLEPGTPRQTLVP